MKLCSRSSWVVRVYDGNEKAVDVTLVVEELRTLVYASILSQFAIGAILTLAFSGVDLDDNFLKRIFGNTNICIIFDFPPSTT